MPVNLTPNSPSSNQVNVLGAPGGDPGEMFMEQAKLAQQGRIADANRAAEASLSREKMAADRAHADKLFEYQKQRDMSADAFEREKLQKEYDWREHDATRAERSANQRLQTELDARARMAEQDRAAQAERDRLQREDEWKRINDQREYINSIITNQRGGVGPSAGGMVGGINGPWQPGQEPSMGGTDPSILGPVNDPNFYGPTQVSTRRADIRRRDEILKQQRENAVSLEAYSTLWDLYQDGQIERAGEIFEKINDMYESNASLKEALKGRMYKNTHEVFLHLNDALENGAPGWGIFGDTKSFFSPEGHKDPKSYNQANKKQWNEESAAWETSDYGRKRLQLLAHNALQEGGDAVARFFIEGSLDGLTDQPIPEHEQGMLMDLLMGARAARGAPGTMAESQFKWAVKEYLALPEDQRSLSLSELDMLIETMDDMASTAGEAYKDFRKGDQLDEISSTGKRGDAAEGLIDARIGDSLKSMSGMHKVWMDALDDDQRRQVNFGGVTDPQTLRKGFQDWMREGLTKGDALTKEQIITALVNMGMTGKNPETGESWASEAATEILFGDEDTFNQVMALPSETLLRLEPIINLMKSEREYYDRGFEGGAGSILESPFFMDRARQEKDRLLKENEDLFNEFDMLDEKISEDEFQRMNAQEQQNFLIGLAMRGI